jgi:hypothetical protein
MYVQYDGSPGDLDNIAVAADQEVPSQVEQSEGESEGDSEGESFHGPLY